MIVACHGGIVGRRIPRVVKTRYISLLPERLRLLMKKWARGRGSRGLFGVVPTAVAAALSILPVTGWTGRDIIKARQICCFVFVTALVTVGNSDRGGDDGGGDDGSSIADADGDDGGRYHYYYDTRATVRSTTTTSAATIYYYMYLFFTLNRSFYQSTSGTPSVRADSSS